MTPEVRDRIDQIRQGIVPEGYKKTKSGILPESWSVRTIAECLERVEHPVEVQANEMYTQIGIRSHGKGLFYKEPVTGDSLGNKSVFWIEPDCFILNIVFAWEQAIGKTTQAEAGMIGSHRFPMYRPINGSIDIDYLISYLLTKRGTDILEAASPGGAGRNRTLGQDRFMKSRIVLPPLDEQQKIAEILSTQDKAIELQARKIEELKRFKKGCLEKMFPRKVQKVPEKRFPGFTDDWEQRKLGDVVQITMGQSPDGSTYSDEPSDYILVQGNADLQNGWVCPRIWTTQITKKADAGDLIMSVRAPAGAMGKTAYNAVIGRGVAAIKGNEFIYQLLVKMDTDGFWKTLSCGSTFESLNSDNIKNAEVKIPTTAEQIKIGGFFQYLDNLITLHQRKLEEMKKQKKALMQLLLTGIVKTKGEVR